MGYTVEANHTNKILVIGRVGTHGIVQRFCTPCWTSDNTLVVTSPYYEFTNQILQKIDYTLLNRGSTQPLITQGDMKRISVSLWVKIAARYARTALPESTFPPRLPAPR